MEYWSGGVLEECSAGVLGRKELEYREGAVLE
jgi:hypothetical protein